MPDCEQQRPGQTKVTGDKLKSAISSQGSAELAVLYLFNRHTIEFANLECLLQGSYSLIRIFIKLILAWSL
jgi:hypothetical protein